MNKKTVLQGLMISLIVVISLSFYLRYFNEGPETVIENKTLEKIDINQSNSSTYIENIDYVSSDAKGNKYQITAERAEIDIDNPDIIFLENVTAYIFIKNSDTIEITSKFGKYNSKNYDTIFTKSVIIVYSSHKITGDYLDFSFLNNLGTISTNVIYTEGKTSLIADKVEMNLTTKDTKIFMTDKIKKIIIKSTK
jgi:LPS export ABC transporter protein LptC